MEKLAKIKLAKIIAGIVKRGARPITVTLRTTPRMKVAAKAKFENPYKICVVNGILNFNYEKSVNRQLVREEKTPDFKTRPSWIEHTAIPGIITNKNDHSKLYLQLKVERAIEASYFRGDGSPISFEEIKPFLYANSKPTHQGVEKFVHVIEIAFSNIKSLVCDGQAYSFDETWGEFFKIDLAKAPKKSKALAK